MRATFIFVLLLALSPVFSQNFYASVDAKEILETSTLTIEFTIKNASGSSFTPPPFKNFNVLKGPSKSQQKSVINGKVSSSLSYTYLLKPKKRGTLSIGKATIKANNKVLSTKPFSIKVLKSDGKTKPGKDYYVTMELSDSIAYMGQQILVDYKLFYEVGLNIRSIEARNEDAFDGFYATVINDYKSKPERQIINGKEYVVQTVRKLALFPQTKGRFDIKEASFVVFFPQTKRRGFYFDSFKEEYVSTKAGVIDVRDLPSQKPFFTGAIGEYTVNSTTNKSTITTDQSFTLNLTISGNGDPKLITAPSLNLSDSLEVYEPNLLQERKYIDDGMQKHLATYEYLIVPQHVGSYTIKPGLIYYNPDSADYLLAEGSSVTLNVIKGSGTGNAPTDITLSERADKMVPLIENMALAKPGKPFYNSYLHWIVFGLMILGFPFLLFYKYLQVQKSNIDPELIKSQRAQKIAEEKLALAKSFMDANNQKPFYNEISNSLLGYASDRLKIPVSKLSSSNITQELEKLQISSSPIADVKEILQACEMALFAGTSQEDKMKIIFSKSKETLSQIELELSNKESQNS